MIGDLDFSPGLFFTGFDSFPGRIAGSLHLRSFTLALSCFSTCRFHCFPVVAVNAGVARLGIVNLLPVAAAALI